MGRSTLLVFSTVAAVNNEFAANDVERTCTAVAIGRKVILGSPASAYSVLNDTTLYGVLGSIKSHNRLFFI